MAIGLLGPFNKIINKTAAEILDSNIIGSVTGIMNAFMTSGIEVIKDITKEEEATEPETEE